MCGVPEDNNKRTVVPYSEESDPPNMTHEELAEGNNAFPNFPQIEIVSLTKRLGSSADRLCSPYLLSE